MKIYTKTGDKGETSLVGGTRVSKTHTRIEAYGTVDELNSWMGLLGDRMECRFFKKEIQRIQNSLFVIGSNLALEEPGKFEIPNLSESDVSDLERSIDELEKGLEPMRNFILPGGHEVVSFCHITRTVCRRSERWVIRAQEQVEIDPIIVQYLNRLSDLLFVLARRITKNLGSEETPWISKKKE